MIEHNDLRFGQEIMYFCDHIIVINGTGYMGHCFFILITVFRISTVGNIILQVKLNPLDKNIGIQSNIPIPKSLNVHRRIY